MLWDVVTAFLHSLFYIVTELLHRIDSTLMWSNVRQGLILIATFVTTWAGKLKL